MSDYIKYVARYPSGNEKAGILSIDGGCRTLVATEHKQPTSIVLPISIVADSATAEENTMSQQESNRKVFPCEDKKGIYVELSPNCHVYAVWYEKYQCYVAIRKLTPKECFRLQGWSDDYFEKAQFVNSDTQLYKQAGNGVTVNVVYEIGRLINSLEE